VRHGRPRDRRATNNSNEFASPHVLPQGEDRILTRRSYRLGRSPHWVKVKNPVAAAVKRAAEEDRGH